MNTDKNLGSELKVKRSKNYKLIIRCSKRAVNIIVRSDADNNQNYNKDDFS